MPALSVIAPAHNEQPNLEPLVAQVTAALANVDFEFIIVDDASTDGSRQTLQSLVAADTRIRALHLPSPSPGRGNGQSAAFAAAFLAASGDLVALMDADLQNDPADLPAMLQRLRDEDADFVQGDRSASRADGAIRVFSSWVGRTARRLLLGDRVRDTGCSLRVMKREIALQLPLAYRGMHRFIPITARQLGYTVIEMPVGHRLREAGTSKYGMWNRAIPGLFDCLAVRWMRRRRVIVSAEEITA